MTIVPSLPAQSLAELLELGAKLRGVATGFQVDLVDGRFVPATSWPFTETVAVAEALTALAPLAKTFALGMDCMVEDPQQYFDVFAALGVQRAIIHYGSTDLLEAIASARAHGFVVGLGILNDTPTEELAPLIVAVDFVQVMGIATIGLQGQPFDERTIATVCALRQHYPQLEIAIDGSVNAETIPRLLEAGANRFAPGSAVAKADDPVEAFRGLQRLVGLQQG